MDNNKEWKSTALAVKKELLKILLKASGQWSRGPHFCARNHTQIVLDS